MIFLDTSAIYALADETDKNHHSAINLLADIIDNGKQIILHNYILVEASALLHKRLGKESAINFLEDSCAFDIIWIDSDLHKSAINEMKNSSSGVSFVDVLSFLVMERKKITQYLGFDKHFISAGFSVYQI